MTPTNKRDTLYGQPRSEIAEFRFNDEVAEVFDDMISRSVPGYDATIRMIGTLTECYLQPNSVGYDLGCSLGAATQAMQQHVRQPGCRLVAVDNSPAMTERCRVLLDEADSDVPVDVVCADILDVPIQQASMVVLNFTLQFIDPELRAGLIQSLYDGLLPGGIVVLSEKVCFADPDRDALLIELHHEFKRANGYSDLEIAQKRTALENVLQRETEETHLIRFREAGFRQSHVWFQCFNFVSMIAIK